MRFPAIAAAAAMLAVPAAAAAQDDAAKSNDVRCVAAFSVLLQTNPALKDAASVGIFYYVGRLDAQDPKLDLAAAIRHQAERMAPSDYATEAQRCGAVLKQRNEALKSVGETLKAGR
jgi:hypothetical protein